jgi:acetamidase/formamidase
MPNIREIHQNGPYRYTYSPFHPPIATVQPGETVVIHTVDAFENKMTPDVRHFADVCTYPFLNPQTGPIVVSGAQPGDTLAVKIHDIVPTRGHAVTGTIPYFGGLTSTKLDPALQPPLEEQWLFLPIDDRGIHFDEHRVIPYEPFLGTMGVAPEIEAVNALTPDYYGGNMDCVETRPGNEVWFPVQVEGAHFFTGDAHASQGDGELTGVALEIPARVTLSFEVKKGYAVKWPRIVSDDFLMVAGSARPLEAAARIAWVELIDWMVSDYGFERMKAYHLLGQVGQMRLGNMVDPKYTMVAKCPRRYLDRL